jgi:alpha-tubulin suppressor-like RCC1 family protein
VAIISGNAQESGSVCIINQDTDLADYFEDISAGQYLVRYVPEGYKTVIFAKESGHTESYGDVLASNPAIEGALYSCGYNELYQHLALGNSINVSVLSIVGLDNDWEKFSCGNYHVLAIKSDGTLWGNGFNTYGQLGISDRYTRSTFTQVGSNTNWSNVFCGTSISLALTTNGTLWSCGYNNYGQLGLGLGSTVHKSTFTQIGSGADWVRASAGKEHFIALKSNGTLWASGRNVFGQLGQNNTLNKSTPIQIGSYTDWEDFSCGDSHNLAIRSNGSMWGCGWNSYGQLGLNDRLNRSVLIQVGNEYDWKSVDSGSYQAAAIKDDGTLWVCGRNEYGELGLNISGVTAHRSTFTQVGSDTDWASVNCGNYNTYALKTNGTLWSCGHNQYGQLGLNDTEYRSTFTRIGSNSDWESISGDGIYFVFCKK